MSVTIDSLEDKLGAYLNAEQIADVRRAYLLAKDAHEGQFRRSGEPYITHPLAVADILADMHIDPQSLMAALMHDVIEDTGVTWQELADNFDEQVANLVEGVSKLTQIEFSSRAHAQAENFQKMTLAMSKDIRVILVKLADRLHNMRTLGVMPPEKKRRIARETLDIYAPIANRLGMNEFRIEFEDLGFRALHPMRSTRIEAALSASRGHRSELVAKIQSAIEKRLSDEGHKAKVIGREKHLFSIYNKMRIKRKSFKDIMDVFAFRILVDSVDNCYRVLGAIHNLYKPISGEFKDYIAIPKSNGYQSLHTVLVGMHGVPIEVQIRTFEMDAMANNGIAAHWLYKSDMNDQTISEHARAREWIKGLLEIQQRAGDSMEFIENVKIDLFPDEVYVFTPKGKIIELPSGATAIDFAYAVHTEIGHHCVACRINRRLAPLSEPLQSGTTCEIITAPNAQPNPAWLNFVITGKARSAIRHYLKQQRHNESLRMGSTLLDKALEAYGSNLDAIQDEQWQTAESALELSKDALLEEIGLGNRLAFSVAQHLLSEQDTQLTDDSSSDNPAIIVDAPGSLMTTFANCCRPIPGDHIQGFLSAGKGVIIHRENCKNVLEELRKQPDKAIRAAWPMHPTGDYLADIHVDIINRRGIIATLATQIANADASIERLDIVERDSEYVIINLTVGISGRVQLAQVLRRIRSIKQVLKTGRLLNGR